MKRALILGIGGQDGSYLAQLLLSKNYEVHGLYRRSSVDNLWRIRDFYPLLSLHQGDLADPYSVQRAIENSEPDEIYNEADQDNVNWSYSTPAYSADITYGAVARTLDFLHQWDTSRRVKFFQPLSATMFGACPSPQSERSSFAPASPYACAKLATYYLCQHYRREYGMFVATGILFNHDSPRRGCGYLLQKICRDVVLVSRGQQQSVKIYNPEDRVDVGFAGDFVDGIYRIVQKETPDDFVLATGVGWKIRDIVRETVQQLKTGWYGGYRDWDGSKYIEEVNSYRNNPSQELIGDITKAKTVLGWEPTCSMQTLISEILSCWKEKR